MTFNLWTFILVLLAFISTDVLPHFEAQAGGQVRSRMRGRRLTRERVRESDEGRKREFCTSTGDCFRAASVYYCADQYGTQVESALSLSEALARFIPHTGGNDHYVRILRNPDQNQVTIQLAQMRDDLRHAPEHLLPATCFFIDGTRVYEILAQTTVQELGAPFSVELNSEDGLRCGREIPKYHVISGPLSRGMGQSMFGDFGSIHTIYDVSPLDQAP